MTSSKNIFQMLFFRFDNTWKPFLSLFLKLLAFSFSVKLRQSVSTTSPENYFAVDVFQNLPYMAKPEAPPFQQFSACNSTGVTEKIFLRTAGFTCKSCGVTGPSKISLFAETQISLGKEKEGYRGKVKINK